MKAGFMEETELVMGNEGFVKFEQARRENHSKFR